MNEHTQKITNDSLAEDVKASQSTVLQRTSTFDPASSKSNPQRSTRADCAPSETSGSVIGAYHLVSKLGEGGMGSVWIAEQEKPVKRRVALKLIKQGHDSTKVIRRFEAERQALALMEHPCIAKVFDGGNTSSGHPYFVMELVEGMPLTQFCDEHKLGLKDRLGLFVQICQAVHHAHQKGIIHRDLKPSNILVSMIDGRPAAKVIDFGVAKATEQSLTGETLGDTGAIVGTPLYMSPEQADPNSGDIDTRTDVYALGVILFELLTGSLPLDGRGSGRLDWVEMLKMVREVEPPKPSTKLSHDTTIQSVAENRSTDSSQLLKALRGDLDWVVMKAIEKDRSHRYESAAGFATDIQRYLSNHPVQARPPSRSYLLHKFIRRNRGAVAASALLLLVLIAGIVGTSWQAWLAHQKTIELDDALSLSEDRRRKAESETARADMERDKAIEENRVSNAVKGFVFDNLLMQGDAYTQSDLIARLGGGFSVQSNPTVGELLVRAAAELTPVKIEQRFPKQDLVQAQILYVVGVAFHRTGNYHQSIAHLERSLPLFEKLARSDSIEFRNNIAALAGAQLEATQYQKAIELYKRLVILGEQNPKLDRRELLLSKLALEQAIYDSGDERNSVTIFEQLRKKLLDSYGEDDPYTQAATNNLARSYIPIGKMDEAARLFERLLEIKAKKYGSDHPSLFRPMNSLGEVYMSLRKIPEAVELFEKVKKLRVEKLGPEHPDTLDTIRDLGEAYSMSGKAKEALGILLANKEIRVRKYGLDHTDTLQTVHFIGKAYLAAGDVPNAIATFEKVLPLVEKKLGLTHFISVSLCRDLNKAYLAAGRLGDAMMLMKRAVAELEKRFGPEFINTQAAKIGLAGSLMAANQTQEAQHLLESLLPVRKKMFGNENQLTIECQTMLGVAYWKNGAFDRAIVLYQELLSVLQQQKGPVHPESIRTATNLAINYRDAGQFKEADGVIKIWLPRAEQSRNPALLNHARHAAISLWELQGEWSKAEPLLTKQLQDSALSASPHIVLMNRAKLANNLLQQKKYSEAEPLLRKSLAEHQEKAPNSWITYHSEAQLGASLLGQKKYVEAELHLVQGYRGLKERDLIIPPEGMNRLLEATQALVQYYEQTGKKHEADQLRTEASKLADKLKISK